MTDTEKLLWAARNGVKPPDFVVARARSSCGDAQQCCCAKKQPVKSCCSKEKCSNQCPKAKPHPAGPGGVLAWQEMRCRGLTASWLIALPTVDPGDTGVPLDTGGLTDPVCLRTPILFSSFREIDTPPPRVG